MVQVPESTSHEVARMGDAFVGALAARLSEGDWLHAAVPYAVRAGAAAVAREGAQGALLYRGELDIM